MRNKCAFVIFRLPRPSYLRRRILVKRSLESWKICLDGRLLSRFLASEYWPRLESNIEKDFYHCLMPQFWNLAHVKMKPVRQRGDMGFVQLGLRLHVTKRFRLRVSRKLRPRNFRPQTSKSQTSKTQTLKTQTPWIWLAKWCKIHKVYIHSHSRLLLLFTNIFIHIQQLSLHSRNIFVYI